MGDYADGTPYGGHPGHRAIVKADEGTGGIMSDTPRTDAFPWRYQVDANFARTLERELAEARADCVQQHGEYLREREYAEELVAFVREFGPTMYDRKNRDRAAELVARHSGNSQGDQQADVPFAPPGYRLVPVQPTHEMLLALAKLRDQQKDGGRWFKNSEAWAAMIDAAPVTGVERGPVVTEGEGRISDTPLTDEQERSAASMATYPGRVVKADFARRLELDAEELANALRDVLAGHPVRNADELIARYSPLLERG